VTDPQDPCSLRRETRRSLLTRALGAAAGTLGLTLLPKGTLAQDEAAAKRPQAGDLLVRASDAGATPLRLADIQTGPPTLAWSMDPTDKVVRNGSRFNQVVLVKLDPATLDAETQARAADGIVAYTVICPHSGCDVAEWVADQQMLLCTCHSSLFDPKRAARVVDGPAPRSLPALPLKAADGLIVVTGGFSDKVGFESA